MMVRRVWRLLALPLAIGIGLGGARAASAEDCPVPEPLLLSGLSLPAAHAALAREGKLVVIALGGSATAGTAAGDPAATYPSRLQAGLARALPGKTVQVLTGRTPRSLTGIRDLTGVVRDAGAHLVIWSTGAYEAAHSIDIDDFLASLRGGVAAIRAADADVILLDMQYAPSIARITNNEPYLAALHGAAEALDVPVLPRYQIMMHWSDSGLMDLDAQEPATRRQVARRVFDCLAALLAPAIVQAVE